MDILVAFFAGTGLGLVVGVFLFAIAVAVGRTRDNETEVESVPLDFHEKCMDKTVKEMLEKPTESELVKAYCKGFDTGVETARQTEVSPFCRNPKGNCFTCKLFEVCEAKTKSADIRN